MQSDPGDYDAWVSQGPKNIHARENLCFTDRGVAKVRRKLKEAILEVQNGGDVVQPAIISIALSPLTAAIQC